MVAVQLSNRRVWVRNRHRPRRPDGHALIRLITAGICNTDIELLQGYYGFTGVPGHEFAGEVVEASSPDWVGRRVVGEINLACGDCEWCARGLGRHCPDRKVLGIVRQPGAFRQYLTLPERNLHVVPDGVPTDHAVFTEPIAAACEILDQVRIHKGEHVAVLGDGKLGLLIVQVLAACGARVRHYGRHREKLAISEKAGVQTALAGTKMPQARFDLVVEATGSPEGLATAVQMTRPRGTVIMKSTTHGLARINTAPVVVNEVTLLGSRCGRFEPALALLKSKKLHLDELIHARFPLTEAPRAFRFAQRPGVLKVLLDA
jgi:alcohol dehydrogenase